MSDKKGGYRLVSLKLVELSTMTACAGLYQAIESSHDKPLCLCDILVSGAKKNNVYVTAIKGTNKYTLKNVYGYDVEVNKDDEIDVTPNADGIELPAPAVIDAGKIVGVNAQGKYELQEQVPNVEDAEAGTIQDTLGLDSQGKLVKGAISGGTKLYLHTISYQSKTIKVITTRSTNYNNLSNILLDSNKVYMEIGTSSVKSPIIALKDAGGGSVSAYYYDGSNITSLQGTYWNTSDETVSEQL